MNPCEMSRKQIRELAESLALEVGKHLTGDWQLAPDPDVYGAYIVSGDMRLCFYYMIREGRVRISGQYPRTNDRSVACGSTRSEITVRPDRNPEHIAREIRRKILPDYTAGLRDHLAVLARRDAAAKGDRATAERIASILGASVATVEPDGRVFVRRDINGNAGGSMRPWGNGRLVEISFRSVPADLAVEIAALIGTYRKRTGS